MELMECHHHIINDPRKLLDIAITHPAMPTRVEVLKLRSKVHADEIRERLTPCTNAKTTFRCLDK